MQNIHCVSSWIGQQWLFRVFDIPVVLARFGMSVEKEMLRHEDEIEKDTHVSQSELDWISDHAAPVWLKAGVNEELEDGQYPTGEIQEDLSNAPSDRRLALVIHPDLWHVLDDRDNEFDVPESVDLHRLVDHEI